MPCGNVASPPSTPAQAADLRVRPSASQSTGSSGEALPDVRCPLSLLSGYPMFRGAVHHPTQALLAPEGSTKPATWLPGPG